MATYERLHHGFLDLIRAIRVDLLEKFVEGGISLQLLVLLLLLHLLLQLVPVLRMQAGCWVPDGHLLAC